MIYPTGVESGFVLNSTGSAVGVSGRCRLKGICVMPKYTRTYGSAGASAIRLHDGDSTSGTGRLVLGYGRWEGSGGGYFRYIPIPGNGILFNEGIFLNFDLTGENIEQETDGAMLIVQR